MSARKSKNMPLVCCQKKTKLSNIELYLYSSNCDKLRSHFQTEPIELKTDFQKAEHLYYHVPTKGVIEPKNQWIYFKNACCIQLTLCSETHKPHNCERWFLSFMAFSVYKVVRARRLSVASLTNQLRN